MKLFGFILVLAMWIGVWPLAADTLILNSDESIEGEIVSDTNDVVQIRVPYNASGTIFTLKTFKHDEIKEIKAADAEQKSFQEVERYKLGANSFSVAYYDQTIQNVFQKFLTGYPSSPRTEIVADSITQWKNERAKVSGGALKWGGRWYEGDATKIVSGQIKAAQLLDDGNRLISSSQYEQAVTKYREALTVRPLPSGTVEQISVKIKTAADRWKTAVSTVATIDPTSFDTQNQLLLAKRPEYQNAINRAINYQKSILAARSVPWKPGIKHWITTAPYGYKDFGSVLPDPHSVESEIHVNQTAIERIDESIAANNAKKASLQSDKASGGAELQKINMILQQSTTELTQARADSKRMEADESQRKATEAIRLAAGSAETETKPMPNQVETASVPPVTPAVVNAPEVSSQPIPPSPSIWTWLRNNWAILAIGCLPVLYLVFRML